MAENIDLLVIYPFHDVPTSVSYQAGTHLVDWAVGKGFNVRTLSGVSALRDLLKNELDLFNIKLISYFGHGGEDVILGTYPPGDLVKYDNVDWLASIPVVTMACLTAKRLGPYAHSMGVPAYFGSDVLMYAAFNELEHDYLKDWIDCETTIPKILLEGGSFGNALASRRTKYSDYIHQYETHIKEWDGADWYIQSFRSNGYRYDLIGSSVGKLKGITEVEEVPEKKEWKLPEWKLPEEWPKITKITDLPRFVFGSFVVGAALVATTVAPIVADIAVKEAKKAGYI